MFVAAACSSPDQSATSSASGFGGASAASASGTGGDLSVASAGAGGGDAGLNADSACAAQSAEATLVKKPIDIILVIDNSGSMTEEIVGVQKNINANFAQIIEQSGIDYRVILVSRHGKTAAQSICIEAPLSGIAMGGCAQPPAQPVENPPRFYQYSVEIGSKNSWCQLLSTFDGTHPDEFGLVPGGWSTLLRPDSFKVFIEITDDGVACGPYSDSNTVNGGVSAAAKFDTDLLALSPANFGTAMARNYRFYSIVALAYNSPPSKPYDPMDPILVAKCPTAATPGTGHQALSVLSSGLRFPICDTSSYDVVFQAIAQGVIDGAKIACEFPVPSPPMGQVIDLSTVVVGYTPAAMGSEVLFKQVANVASCVDSAFYIEAGSIKLCPSTCDLVQKDAKAKLEILYGCDPNAPH